MQQLSKLFFSVLLSPLAFAIGFLWPLATQIAIGMEWFTPGWQAILCGAAIALPFGLLAQFRGSWLWIR